jgi:hypothetical protein
VNDFLARLEALWPTSIKTLQALREHNEYLEDQGYADIILENLDENLKAEEKNVGDGITWDDSDTGNLETD